MKHEANDRVCGRRDFRAGAGFTLIELMVALTLSVLLALGLATLFSSTSHMNRVQRAMSRLQENGRLAVEIMSNDLRMIGGQHCSNAGGAALPGNIRVANTPRAPMVYFSREFTLPDFDSNTGPSPPPPVATSTVYPPPGWPTGTAFPLSPRFFLQGYRCNSGTDCVPQLPTPSSVPAGGSGDAQRPAGSDVLTMRYLRAPGWSIVQDESSQACDASGAMSAISVVRALHDPPFNFAAGDLALVADCAGSEVIGVDFAAGAPAVFTPAQNFTAPQCVTTTSDARIFNFSRDFVTVSYFLRLDADPGVPGRLISSLYRSINGVPEQLVQGVERMNFLYGVQDLDGAAHLYTADRVTSNPDGLTCPPAPLGYKDLAENGCLWRAVQSVEMFLLVDSIDDMALGDNDQSFRYSFDALGDFVGLNNANAPAAPSNPLPSGLAPGKLLRREFRSAVSVHNYNP